MEEKLKVFCDFDGTISAVDVTNFILSRLADPSWNNIEQEWIRGEIGSRECLDRQIPLIRGGWNAVEALLAEVPLDPDFSEFSALCAAEGVPVAIVSDGLDRVIEALLAREKIEVAEIWANQLVEDDSGKLSIRFPYPPSGKLCRAGLCKCEVLSRGEQLLKIVIGDGQSDYCWAGKAGRVFAKSKLLEHCREFQMPNAAYESFGDVLPLFREMIKQYRIQNVR